MSVANLTPTLEDAIVLAAQAHRGQIYPSPEGEPFILHPLRVMSKVTSSAERVVAVLHDVIEDTNYTLDNLRHLGYSERVIDALDRLTHRDGEAYETYIERIKDDPVAQQVKLADIVDNLANNRRVAELASSIEVQERIMRYERAIVQLKAAAAAANAEPPM